MKIIIAQYATSSMAKQRNNWWIWEVQLGAASGVIRGFDRWWGWEDSLGKTIVNDRVHVALGTLKELSCGGGTFLNYVKSIQELLKFN